METSKSDSTVRVWVFRIALIMIAIAVICLMIYILRTPDSVPESSVVQNEPVSYRLENIGELSTQTAYITNVQVISNSRTIFGVTVPFTQSKYIYSYDCIVRAGIDFSLVTYTVDPLTQTITVTLPPSSIHTIVVDEDSLVVYDESQNMFSPLKLDNIQASRLKMREDAHAHAIKLGLLNAAAENSKVIIQAFLLSNPEYAEYTIIWQTAETADST